MKRYAVFSFPTFYPSGGWYDFDECFDTPEEAAISANRILAELLADWGEERFFTIQIIDTHTGENIRS
jgi:hypothetical protein